MAVYHIESERVWLKPNAWDAITVVAAIIPGRSEVEDVSPTFQNSKQRLGLRVENPICVLLLTRFCKLSIVFFTGSDS